MFRVRVRMFLCGICMFSLYLFGFSPGTPASSQILKNQNWGRLIGHSKLSIGVNVSMDGCLSLYVSPAMNWQLVQGVPCLHLMILG